MRRVKQITLTLLLSGIVSGAWAFSPEGLQQQGPSEEVLAELSGQHLDNPDSIATGRQLFGNTCLFCHGPEGKGARAPSLVTGAWRPGGGNTPEYLYSVVINGRPGTIMGSFRESHTDEQIWQIIAFLRDVSTKIAGEAK
ncbi:c-type cytochrome [Pontibacter sp. JAM-7]|uniref:c-type cytochrome n=1 Tax=Pontibacter sp. JAM-7 TaxID=3366581 RepID=UPI003AF54CF6